MRSKFLFPVVLVAGLMLVSFSVSQVYGQAPQDKVVKQQAKQYTCPMHSEVIKDMPGNCPKCNGLLIEKKDVPTGVKQAKKDSTIIKKAKKTTDTTSVKREPIK